MRKLLLLFTGLSLLLFLTACQLAESKEVLAYHNDYVDNVSDKMEAVDELNSKIWNAETDEEVTQTIDKELEPLFNTMKEYMDSQNPETDVTKEYHKMRLDSFNAFYESMQLDVEAFKAIINESMTEEEIDGLFEESIDKFKEAETLAEEANEKFLELSDKYKFEEIEEE